MKMNRAFIYTVIIIIVIFCLILTYKLLNSSHKTHFHAGFTVYIDGVKQDFSDIKYMSVEQCNNSTNVSNPQLDNGKVHLHDGIGDVAHIHQSGAIWKDLFDEISFVFPKNLPVYGYRSDGKKIPDILNYQIHPFDSVVIISGMDMNPDKLQFVTKQHILDVEKKSESCSS